MFARTTAILCLAVALALPWGASRAQRESTTPPVELLRRRLPHASTAGVGDRIATIVRVDTARVRFRFLSEGHEGRRRPLPAWVRDARLLGGINAGMFMPDGRSVGYMRHAGVVRSARRPSRFEAILGFAPRGEGPPIRVAGPGCGGSLNAVLRTHDSVLQARKVMIDCRGRPVEWRTGRYSAAAFGVDDRGHALLVHVRTPYRMTRLARMLAGLDLNIRGLVYMEGGPEASLVVRSPGARVSRIGSYEDGFNPNDDNHEFWDLPNVIGFEAR